MKRNTLLLLVVAAFSLAPAAFAQDDASRILGKIRHLDILNQILPVLMTTDQIKKILPSVEKARAAEKATEKDELTAMKAMEAKLDEALKDARTKGLVASKELTAEVTTLLGEFQKKRALMILTQNEAVLKTVEETLDEGQIKAAANSIKAPDDKENKLTDRDKLRRWVRGVLMDPMSYDILVEMSRGKGGG